MLKIVMTAHFWNGVTQRSDGSIYCLCVGANESQVRKERHLTPLKHQEHVINKEKEACSVHSHFRSLDGAGLLPDNFDVVDRVMQELKNSTNFVKSVDSWHEKFTNFVNQEFLYNQPLKLPSAEMSKSFFQQKLTQFLFTKGKRKSDLILPTGKVIFRCKTWLFAGNNRYVSFWMQQTHS